LRRLPPPPKELLKKQNGDLKGNDSKGIIEKGKIDPLNKFLRTGSIIIVELDMGLV
jgi:hypothetical protein